MAFISFNCKCLSSKSYTCSRTAELAATSEQSSQTVAANMEICETIDKYGRNIARIQMPRSILYENAIEIKESDEKDDDNDDDES